MAWAVFKVVDAVGDTYCVTGSSPDYESAYRKHVAWWRNHVKSAEYRKKVDPSRWPVEPVKIVIEHVN